MNALRRLQVTDHADVRGQGAIVGFLVAWVFVAGGLVMQLGDEDGPSLFLTEGIPALVAGLIGGWLLAPRAARASTRRQWLGIVLRLGVVAVIVGAIGVGIALGADSAVRSRADIGQFILSIVVGALILAPIGILVMGWMILPVTTVAAGIWAFAMARLLRPAPGRAR